MGWMKRVRRGLAQWPAWGWLAAVLVMMIAVLWLTYWVVDASLRPGEGTVATVPTFTPTPLQAAAASASGSAPTQVAPTEVASAQAAPTGEAVAAAAEPVAPVQLPTLTAPTAPTPAPTALPAPTAAATPLPQEQLALGLQAYRLGDYSAARSRLAALLTSQEIAGDTRRQAQFELAKAYLADGYFAEAIGTLDQLQAEDDLSLAAAAVDAVALQEIQALAGFLRGEALAGLGRYDEAIAAYTRFLQGYPAAAAAVQPKLADIYLALGNSEAAASAYQAAADGATNTVQQVGLLEKMAAVHSDAGRHAAAAAAYEAILSVAQIPVYRAEVMNKAARA